MGTTTFTGPIMAGDNLPGSTYPNVGYSVLEQDTYLMQNSTNPVSATLYIPTGARIIDFKIDVLTAFNSVTSAVLSVGTTAGGTDYVSGVSVTVAGRAAPTFTAAQLAAMDNVTVLGAASPTVAPVVVTITPTGTTTAGYVQVSVIYAQQ